MKTNNRYLVILIAILLVLRAVTFFAASYFDIGLVPDEAQYWTWSKELSYGYYSKPAGIAWEIAVGTFFFGDTEFGVRFGAALVGTLLPIALYSLSLAAGFEAFFAFCAALSFALCPLGIVAGFLATTDGGFLLFLVLSLIPVYKAMERQQTIPWYLVGVIVAFGAFFKWAIYLLWIPLLGLALVRREPVLKVLLALLISFLGLLPSLLWNYTHDFATFKHVFFSVAPHSVKSAANPGSFFLAQFGLLSPVLFALLVVSFGSMLGKIRKLPITISFSLVVSLFFFSLVQCLACFKKVQVNWAAAAYPTAFIVLLSWVKMGSSIHRRLLYSAVVISVILVGALPPLSSLLPYKMNIFKENVGWNKLDKGLTDLGYNPEKDLLIGDRYQMVSLLSFYGPQQQRAYFLNFHGIRKNQFSYFQQERPLEKGKTCFYVTLVEGTGAAEKIYHRQNAAQKYLQPYFGSVSSACMAIPLYKEQKIALVVRAEGYNGLLPPDGTSW